MATTNITTLNWLQMQIVVQLTLRQSRLKCFPTRLKTLLAQV